MLKLDLHIHSKHSPDSALEIAEIVRTATRRGLQGVAVTDHNGLRGSEEARARAREAGLLALRGSELSTREGHVLAYGIQEAVPPRLSVEETVERIREQGGLAVAAHPYRFWSGLGEPAVRRCDFDALEGLNARSVAPHNQRAEGLAAALGLPMTAGSDAHRQADIGRGLLLLPDGLEDEEDLLAALRKGEGKPAGLSRSGVRTLGYVVKSVGEWIFRGFRKM